MGRTATFCTVFPNYRDFHFFKDPGQIPYRFAKIGYNTRLVCYSSETDTLTVTGKYLSVVKIPDRFTSRKFNAGIVRYLMSNAMGIDILNVFHYSWSSLLFAYIYKLFNRKGFVYLKLDYCAYAVKNPGGAARIGSFPPDKGSTSLKGRIKDIIASRYFVKKVDLWSVEDDYSRQLLESNYDFLRARLITVYNGHTSDLPGSLAGCDSSQKEDIILTAGRLGSMQKATEVLLEAFKSIASLTEYNLHLAGSVEPGFNAYMNSFLRDNPSLFNRVKLHGPLGRDDLYRLYCRSRIFCMPSRFEGMAIVFPEAMYYGNVIITTNNTSLKPLVEKHRFGLVVERDNPGAIADAVLSLARNRELLKEMAVNAQETASTLLSWDNIVELLNDKITEKSTASRIR